MTSPDFRRLFESAPDGYVVLTPDLRIVAASDGYLKATMRSREDLVGRPLFEAFPVNPDQDGSSAEADLRASVARVIATRRPDTQPVHTYDIRRSDAEGGTFERRHWSPMNAPVLDDAGRVALILHAVEDVTEQVRARQRLQEMSTPVVTVRDRVLLLPLVGDVDHVRSEQIMETVLHRVVEDQARAIIIDVAGVPVMDSAVAGSLIKTARAASLLGAHTILTGVGPHAAKTIVSLGIDLSGLHTRTHLTEGIDLALRLLERRAPSTHSAHSAR